MLRQTKLPWKFSAPGGADIADPRPLINIRPFDRVDYRAYDPNTDTYIAENWGNRPQQEDRYLVELFPPALKMNSESFARVVTATIEDLHKAIIAKVSGKNAGSTLCLTYIADNSIYVASVGDSEALIIIRDKNNHVQSVERLNVQHTITDQNVASLRQQGCNIIRDQCNVYRLGQTGRYINMYRAIGDALVIPSGMQHTPTFTIYKVDLPEELTTQVINACDGLVERHALSRISEYLQKYSPTMAQTTNFLARLTEKKRTSDNVTILSTPVKRDLPPKYLAVFDGHGGPAVSEYLKSHFHLVFVKNAFWDHCRSNLSHQEATDLAQASTRLHKGEHSWDYSLEVYYNIYVKSFDQTLLLPFTFTQMIVMWKRHCHFMDKVGAYFQIIDDLNKQHQVFSSLPQNYKPLLTSLTSWQKAYLYNNDDTQLDQLNALILQAQGTLDRTNYIVKLNYLFDIKKLLAKHYSLFQSKVEALYTSQCLQYVTKEFDLVETLRKGLCQIYLDELTRKPARGFWARADQSLPDQAIQKFEEVLLAKGIEMRQIVSSQFSALKRPACIVHAIGLIYPELNLPEVEKVFQVESTSMLANSRPSFFNSVKLVTGFKAQVPTSPAHADDANQHPVLPSDHSITLKR